MKNMRTPVIYIPLRWALYVHDLILSISGGVSGINPQQKGQLDSVLSHIKNDIYYPSIVEKTAHLVYSVIMFHIFIDANKRTSMALGQYFLSVNNYECQDFFPKMEPVVVMIASHLLSKDELNIIISCLVKRVPYPEAIETKMKNYESKLAEENNLTR